MGINETVLALSFGRVSILSIRVRVQGCERKEEFQNGGTKENGVRARSTKSNCPATSWKTNDETLLFHIFLLSSFFPFPLLPLPSFFLFFIFIFLFLFFGIYCFNNSSNAVGCKWHGGSRRIRDPSRICIILSVRNISVENTVENYYVALLLISKIFWRVYQFIILSKNYLIRFEVLKSISFFFLNKNC